ncbi:hypothetical protein B0H14DRAFT_839018 [Mycena olivaceomarginata]|nr:hypothetical protein B0H14DRAFT_839018 [Mycena olivaceomarginata]
MEINTHATLGRLGTRRPRDEGDQDEDCDRRHPSLRVQEIIDTHPSLRVQETTDTPPNPPSPSAIDCTPRSTLSVSKDPPTMLGDNDSQTVNNHIYGGQGGNGGEGGRQGGRGGAGEGPTLHYDISTTHLTVNNLFTDVPFVRESVSHFDECPPPSPIFEGRRNILDEMQQYFSQNRGKRHISVLHGLGGAGKTQTALKFVDENNDRVFFVDASTVGTLDLSFKKLVIAKRAGNTTQDALRWMISQQSEWLILFNNVDDPSINLQQFFPRCRHGNILITTRNFQLRMHAPDSNYKLSDMEEADAVALLLRSSANGSNPENQVEARRVVQALHCFPLAVVQAGAFIAKNGALERYLDLYKENKARLLRERPTQTHDDYAWTVYTTWQISFDCLGPVAARLLQLSSFLHHGGIAKKIFCNAVLCDSTIFGELGPTNEDLRDARKFLTQFVTSSGTWSQLVFLESTAELQSYSLIELDSLGESYSIHPLVHSWIRDSVTDPRVRDDALAIVGMCIPVGDHLDDHQLRMKLLPHVDSLLAQTREMEPSFLLMYGSICLNGGRAAAAAELFERLAVNVKRLLGEEHPDTLGAMAYLANSYSALGQSKEAAELRKAVLEKSTRLLGEEHPDTLQAMAYLADSYSALGQSKEAAELRKAVLEKRTRLLGEKHPDTLRAMAYLAISYSALGQSKEAAELRKAVLEKRTRLLGEKHPDTLQAMAYLAISYSALGQSKEAAELQKAVLEKSTRLLGEEHPDTLQAMAYLANSYSALGQSKEAAELRKAVLEKSTRLLGKEHPDTLRAMANLANSYSALGQPKEAAELRKAVLEKRTRLLGEKHPDTLRAMAYLANSYSALGQSKWQSSRRLFWRRGRGCSGRSRILVITKSNRKFAY